MTPATLTHQLDLPVRSVRKALDRYDTPPAATRALLGQVPELCGGLLVDPCAGDCSMARMIGARFATVSTNDIDRSTPADSHMDALDPQYWTAALGADWVVTNPPYSEAGLIVQQALRASPRVGVAMLLRLTFAEACASTKFSPASGRTWLSYQPWSFMITLPRLNFTGRGTDSATVAWFVWLNGQRSRNAALTRADLRALDCGAGARS